MSNKKMKISTVSDLHQHYPEIPESDVLVIAGDLFSNSNWEIQGEILRGEFVRWVRRCKAKHVVCIAGNHDFIFQDHPNSVPDLNVLMESIHEDHPKPRWHYLQDSSCVIDGIKFYGSPWTPIFYDWAFNASENDLKVHFSKIESDTDVLITHGPPLGIQDSVQELGAWKSVGSRSLMERLFEIKPAAHVFGHIHSGRGIKKIGFDNQETICFNTSVVDERYRLVYEPFVFEIGNDKKIFLENVD